MAKKMRDTEFVFLLYRRSSINFLKIKSALKGLLLPLFVMFIYMYIFLNANVSCINLDFKPKLRQFCVIMI